MTLRGCDEKDQQQHQAQQQQQQQQQQQPAQSSQHGQQLSQQVNSPACGNAGKASPLPTNSLSSNNNSTTNKSQGESKLVECSLCRRQFKNIPALNGHMRLHGGYFKKQANSSEVKRKKQGRIHQRNLLSKAVLYITLSALSDNKIERIKNDKKYKGKKGDKNQEKNISDSKVNESAWGAD
ncbi:hypothetical protein PV325_009726 [Microctonus aethiopoides]|nr:hypothetical protein PV325_009726 [Microctonus aethiopoides]